MKSGKLVTGLAIGAVVALFVIPKTRKMISDAVSKITDSFKDIMDDASDLAKKGKKEAANMADKARDVAGSVKATKEAWQ